MMTLLDILTKNITKNKYRNLMVVVEKNGYRVGVRRHSPFRSFVFH